ncbi:MAG: hypothetical protein ACK56F_03605, partial [bacterium]
MARRHRRGGTRRAGSQGSSGRRRGHGPCKQEVFVKVAHVEKSLVAERASPPPRTRAAGKEEAFRVPDDDAEPEHKAKPEGPAEDPPGDDANPAARALGLSPELCAWLLPLGAQTPSPAQEDRLEGSAHDPSGAAPFAVGDP